MIPSSEPTCKQASAWSASLAMAALGMMLGAQPAQAYFGENPEHWLEKMGEALNSVNYRGTFVYIHDDRADTMLVIHRVDKQGTRERLVSLNGSAREVVRDDDTVKCFLPDDKSVLVEERHTGKTLTKGVPLNPTRYADVYSFNLYGMSRIAGRKARLVTIEPRDAYRYGYRLWLDDATALPLRSELVNDNGQSVEKMFFTEIQIGIDIPDEELDPSVSGDDYEWRIRTAGKGHETTRGTIPLTFSKLPAGFTIARSEVEGEVGKHSYHLVLSDGLSSVSVFAEPVSEGKPALAGLSRLGAVNAFGIRRGSHHITVVGEVPEATVMAIGESVQLASN